MVEEIEFVHEHCATCYNINCVYDPLYLADCKYHKHSAEFSSNNPYGAPQTTNVQLFHQKSCPMVVCLCGVRHHQCKSKDHQLICQDAIVPCINQMNGCPSHLSRCRLRTHLQYCPASVIHCTMEWNRWPVYSAERQSHVPFAQENLHARYGQLDVALALRDQRMLNQALKAPRSTTRALKNTLTPRFPAVPLLFHNTTINNANNSNNDLSKVNEELPARNSVKESSLNASDDEAPWMMNRSPPGLARSVYNKLMSTQSDTENGHLSSDGYADEGTAIIRLSEDTVPAGKLLVYTCQVDINRPNCKSLMKQNCPEGITAGADVNTTRAALSPPAIDAPGPALKQILGLDLTLQAISPFTAKPPSMYTFMCAQELRRDQYSAHFLNVHMEIHGGLSGWLEHRCPLAHYGCTYSRMRLLPESIGNKLIYSEHIEGYGVKPFVPDIHNFKYQPISTQVSKEGTPEIFTSKDFNSAIHIEGKIKVKDLHKLNVDLPCCDTNESNKNCDSEKKLMNSRSVSFNNEESFTLLHLPEEVLLHVAQFLDSFSLYHVALSCTTLRDVCRRLLETKGIVVQQWERTKDVNNKYSWNVSYHKWMYSCAFTEVGCWKFNEDGSNMSDHLKACPFNAPSLTNNKPFHLPCMMSDLHEHSFLSKMQRMYPLQDLAEIKKKIELDKYQHQQQMENIVKVHSNIET